jgi:uncharacterized membrane protein YdjX (TVP38/TMEM64 family)
MFETAMVALVATYGTLGLAAMMFLQTVIAIIPSEAVLLFAGAMGMDVWDIALYGGAGLLAGSVFAFFVARRGGRPVVVKLLGERWTREVDSWITRNGTKAILATRLIPVVPFDMISYASGVTRMRFRDYFLATAVGIVPRCLFLAYAGSIAGGLLAAVGTGIEVVFVLGVGGFIVLVFLERKGYIGDLRNNIIGRLMRRKWK